MSFLSLSTSLVLFLSISCNLCRSTTHVDHHRPGPETTRHFFPSHCRLPMHGCFCLSLHYEPCSPENDSHVLSLSNSLFIPSTPHLSPVCLAHSVSLDLTSPKVTPFSKLYTKCCTFPAPSLMIYCNSSWLHLPLLAPFPPTSSQPPSDSHCSLSRSGSVFPVM